MNKRGDGSISLEERQRLQELRIMEEEAFQEGYNYIAGLDEVGRGPIAGPVVAAAVILPQGFLLPDLE
jgi:ribonuclease HII